MQWESGEKGVRTMVMEGIADETRDVGAASDVACEGWPAEVEVAEARSEFVVDLEERERGESARQETDECVFVGGVKGERRCRVEDGECVDVDLDVACLCWAAVLVWALKHAALDEDGGLDGHV